MSKRTGHLCLKCGFVWIPNICRETAICNHWTRHCPPCDGVSRTDWEYEDEFAQWAKTVRDEAGVFTIDK